jgi:hypothetical protein
VCPFDLETRGWVELNVASFHVETGGWIGGSRSRERS